MIDALQGGPAASAGLVGADNRTDPVGDVIYTISYSSKTWLVGNCADYTNALAAMRPGDVVSIQYWHRVVVFSSGKWVAESTQATLVAQP